MKKSVLAIALAVLMTVSLLTVGAMADGTVYEAGNQDEIVRALAIAQDGDTVRLTNNIELVVKDSGVDEVTPILYIKHDITLDLNTFSITLNQDNLGVSLACTPCIICVYGADVTITGDGTIDAEAQYNNSYGINVVTGGSLTIESGTFKGAPTAVQAQTGTVNVYGGEFELAETISQAAPDMAKYVINAVDSKYKSGSADISITGGTFVGFNPNENPEGPGTSYVVGECTVDSSTGSVVISAPTTQSDNSVAEVNGMYFTNLSNAIAAANRGATVKLLKDFTEEDVVIPKLSDITLDLNGKTFNAGEKLISQGNLTIIDSTPCRSRW